MKYDPRCADVSDRCRALALAIRRGEALQPAAVAQIAEDLAALADEVHALVNRPERGVQPDSGEFKPPTRY